MKGLALLLAMLFIAGCSFIVQDNGGLKSIGIKEEQANNWIKEIEAQRPANLGEINLLHKRVSSGAEEKIKIK